MARFLIDSTVTLTAAAAGNYDAADIVAQSATNDAGVALEFLNMAPAAGRPGTIYAAKVTCSEDSVVWRLRLHLFAHTSAANADWSSELDDNAAKAFDNDERTKYQGYIDFPAMIDLGEFSFAQSTGLSLGYKCADGETSLFGVVETLDAETNETAGMTLEFTLYAYAD